MIHLTGPDVMVEGRFVRQRCAWCGVTILDYDLERTQSIDGKPPSMFATGRFVEVEDGVMSLLEVDHIPDTSCMLLDPAVTR